jgi:hypothetical protein
MGKQEGLPERLSADYELAFPNLKDYVVTSPQDTRHNCVAFAAGATARWWEPLTVSEPGFYWPPGAVGKMIMAILKL